MTKTGKHVADENTRWRGAEKLRALLTPLAALKNDERNARAHDERSFEAVRTSLAKFGQRKPIVVDGDVVIAGNGTLVAARREGWTHIATVDADGLSAEEKRAYALADNRTAELSSWDYGALHAEMQTLAPSMSLLDVGWTPAEVKTIERKVAGRSIGGGEEGGPPSGPSKPTPVSRPGEVYELGRHRLAVGDATDKAFVRAAIGSADIVVTDPPYGVSYEGTNGMKIANDELAGEALTDFLRRAFGAAASICKPGACWYVFAPAGPALLSFGLALTELSIWRQTLIWEKSALVLGHSDYHYRHETLFYGWMPGVGGHVVPLDRAQDSLWEAKKPARNEQHPTMKPPELYERALMNSSNLDDIVFDSFGGSGTAIIAAENTGRIARVTELDLGYADGIRRRWTALARARGIDPGPGALDD